MRSLEKLYQISLMIVISLFCTASAALAEPVMYQTGSAENTRTQTPEQSTQKKEMISPLAAEPNLPDTNTMMDSYPLQKADSPESSEGEIAGEFNTAVLPGSLGGNEQETEQGWSGTGLESLEASADIMAGGGGSNSGSNTYMIGEFTGKPAQQLNTLTEVRDGIARLNRALEKIIQKRIELGADLHMWLRANRHALNDIQLTNDEQAINGNTFDRLSQERTILEGWKREAMGDPQRMQEINRRLVQVEEDMLTLVNRNAENMKRIMTAKSLSINARNARDRIMASLATCDSQEARIRALISTYEAREDEIILRDGTF